MDWMNLVGGLVQQYAGGNVGQPGQVEQHYDQVQQALPASAIATGLAGMLGGGQAGGFGQLAGQLFGGGGAPQASMLNALIAAAGPSVLASVMSQHSMPGLSSILQGGQPRELSPDEAAQVSPEEIQHLANHVQQHDPSIVDRVSEIYAEHPAIVKTLGSAALAVAMAKFAQSTQHS